MKNKNKLIPHTFLIIIFLAILLFFIANYNNKNTLQEYMDNSDVSWEDAGNLIVNKSLSQITENKAVLISESNNKIIRLEIINDIDKETAEKHIANKKYIIDSLFLDISAPYPDAITTTLECPEQFKPKIREIKIDNFDMDYYEIFATERLTYGACSDDLINYKAILTWVYCKNTKNLLQIELFVPKAEFKEDHIDLFDSFK